MSLHLVNHKFKQVMNEYYPLLDTNMDLLGVYEMMMRTLVQKL